MPRLEEAPEGKGRVRALAPFAGRPEQAIESRRRLCLMPVQFLVTGTAIVGDDLGQVLVEGGERDVLLVEQDGQPGQAYQSGGVIARRPDQLVPDARAQPDAGV